MQPASQFCDSCGAPNRPQARFCIVCQNQLPGLPPSLAQPPPQAQQPGQAQVSNSLTGRLNISQLLKQRYRILGPAGQGGMGAVYKAEDISFGNALRAVKEMSQSGLNPQELQETTDLFKHEAILLAGLMHQNLPRIYDHFKEGERWYLVMDYVQGETLQNRLEKSPDGKLALEEVCAIALQLCTVLDYLHTSRPQQPIIFRDLKPANIMLTTDDHLYLIDFGIARLFKPGQFRDTVAMISPGYAPPEQYGRMQTDPRADIYSLGATLHHLLSGNHPAQNPFMFAPLRLNSHPASSEFATLIMQMLQLDRDQRPASMSQIKKTLQRLIQQLSTPMPVVQPKAPNPVIPALAPTVVASAPIIVSPSGAGHYRSITEAIKQATPHTRILVRPGLYKEGLVLDKSLDIIGDGPKEDIIIESRDTYCLQMQTDEALVQGLTLRCRAGEVNKQYYAVDIPRGQLVLSDCDITSDSLSCVAIHGSTAKPTLRRCQIHDGKGGGVYVYEQGAGTVEDCDIYANALSGVAISEGGHPVVRRCQIHDGKQGGVYVYEQGAGTVEDCDIFANAYPGVAIREGGNPVVRHCRINRNKYQAISVHDQGKGTVENCDLTKNDGGAWNIEAGCTVQRRRNIE